MHKPYKPRQGSMRKEHKKHKKFIKNFTPQNNNITPQIPNKKSKLILDEKLALSFIEFLVEKNVISKEELLNEIIKEEQPLNKPEIVLEPGKVIEGRVQFNGRRMDKGALRALWEEQQKQGKLYCCLCGRPISAHHGVWRLTAEHTIPKSKGGKTDSTNLLPAHSICNSIKTNIMPKTWERVGYSLLRSRNIQIDLEKAAYNYIIDRGR